MTRTVRVARRYVLPFLVFGIIAACGGGGGGTTAPSTSPPSGAAPAVASPTATSVDGTRATLTGTVTANGLATEFWFEYGTDPTLQSRDNTARRPVDPGAVDAAVAESVVGLAAETVYHYRICASNSRGSSSSPIFAFTTRACLSCHGGLDGSQPAVNGAPVVTRYWQTSGHGRSFPSRGALGAVACRDCHDAGYLTCVDHKTDGTAGAGPPPGNVNTLAWPGKTGNANNAPTANTSHLKQAYFPSSPVFKRDYARAVNRKCGDPAAGCHRFPPHNHHPMIPAGSTDPADNVMRFGDSTSLADPKAYAWYPECQDYVADFYKSPSVWEIEDLTTSASGFGPDAGVRYGTCVTCHDPHGTGATDMTIGGRNAMVRGNSTSEPGQFCNKACHRSP